ncbi:MAG: DUF6982 domain-containing protein [Smithella sp.]
MVFDFQSNQEASLITILGITNSYQSTRPGFFLAPADIISNNERYFVATSAIQKSLSYE